jgi:hypothetical protein
MQKTALDIVLEAINRHDVKGLVALMTEDHCFVDGLGEVVRGRERMEKGWVGYFGWFPDYCVRVDEILSYADNEPVWKNHGREAIRTLHLCSGLGSRTKSLRNFCLPCEQGKSRS